VAASTVLDVEGVIAVMNTLSEEAVDAMLKTGELAAEELLPADTPSSQTLRKVNPKPVPTESIAL
jgi:hypothetical protein